MTALTTLLLIVMAVAMLVTVLAALLLLLLGLSTLTLCGLSALAPLRIFFLLLAGLAGLPLLFVELLFVCHVNLPDYLVPITGGG